MARPLKIKRRPELTACLKKNGFRKNVESSDSDSWVYEHKADDNRVVIIRSFEIATDIVKYKEFPLVPTETPVEEIIAYIDAEMQKSNEAETAFHALRVAVQVRAKQLGVVGKYQRGEVDTHAYEFFANGYKAEPLFYLSYTGPSNKPVLGLNSFSECDVSTADEVIELLQGKSHEYWPSESERIVFDGKSIFTFKSPEDFVPFMFTHGLISITERIEKVVVSAPGNKNLNALLESYPETKHYTEIKLRRAITTEEFFEYIKNKTAGLEMAKGEFA